SSVPTAEAASSSTAPTWGRRPPPTKRTVTIAPLQFVDDGAFAFIDGKTGAALTLDEVLVRLRHTRAVMVGEQHDQPAHHELQRRVVQWLGSDGPGLVVGMEMLSWEKQRALDAFNAGSIDVDGLGAAVDWQKTWGFPLALYAPIFVTGHDVGARFVALNAPKELVRAVRTQGLQALRPVEQELLPELDLDDELHRAWFEGVFSSAGHPLSASDLDGFYRAQVVWDEAMADRAAHALLVEKARQVVVVAGAGHVAAGRGVPQRLERRLKERVLTIVTLTVSPERAVDELEAAVASDEADILVVPRFEVEIDI
ncbi:MAG TPA: ChaN family lipoprotein, partial [Myxococcota bacterium]